MGSQTDLPWNLDIKTEEEVSKTIADNDALKVYSQAKQSVTQDPITNRKSSKIKGGRYKGMMKWKKPPFRYIYGVKKETRTIYSAIFDRRGHIDY